jgi:deazaflavin-dependent oxidoreductase (nitroreductase family)
MSPTRKQFPPPSLKRLNKVIVALQRLGIVLGTMRLLTVYGRKSGKPRTTPVSPFTVDGHRYVISAATTEWVKNARVHDEGVLARGRRSERVRLVELPEHERGAILREFPLKVPHGVDMLIMSGAVEDGSQEGFEAAAPRCAVFRVERL